jgi:hypothetical protein
LQRLPRGTIERAQVGGKILVQKHPGAAHLGPWDASCLGPLAQLFGVEAQELGGFLEVKGAHIWPPRELRAPMARRSRQGQGTGMPQRHLSDAARQRNRSGSSSPAPQDLNRQVSALA